MPTQILGNRDLGAELGLTVNRPPPQVKDFPVDFRGYEPTISLVCITGVIVV